MFCPLATALATAVFFITGPCDLPQGSCGLQSWDLLAESAADYKAPQWRAIESEGYTIVANLGDQPSDLDGGFAERTLLLPNPLYRIP